MTASFGTHLSDKLLTARATAQHIWNHKNGLYRRNDINPRLKKFLCIHFIFIQSCVLYPMIFIVQMSKAWDIKVVIFLILAYLCFFPYFSIKPKKKFDRVFNKKLCFTLFFKFDHCYGQNNWNYEQYYTNMYVCVCVYIYMNI